MTDRPNDGASEPSAGASQPTPGPSGVDQPAPGSSGASQPALGPSSDASQPGATPTRRNAAFIAAASLAIVLLLCGGGGTAAFFLLRNAESEPGASDPVAAVDAFMEAVYIDQDPALATSMVCLEARDEAAVTKKVQEVKEYANTYVEPRFEWEQPTVATQNDERAIVSVKLTMTTKDDKLSHQQLRFTVVQKTGWWICEVS